MALEKHDPARQDETQFASKRFGAPYPLWQKVLLFGLAYLACAEVSYFLSVPNNKSSSFWLPAGLYVAVLLLNRTEDWVYFLLAAFPSNLIYDLAHGTKLEVIFLFYCANTVEALTGAWLMRRWVAERPAMATLREFSGFLGLTVVLSAAFGATIGAWTLVHSKSSQSFTQSWEIWWGSCAMATLLLGPFILTWFSRAGQLVGIQFSPARMGEALLLFFALAIFEWYLLAKDSGVMSQDRAWAALLFLWAGLRFGPRGASAAALCFSVSLAFCTLQFHCGLTPAQVASGEYVFVIQLMLAMASLVALVPAVVLNERDQAMVRLRESEERFRHLTQAAFEGVCVSEQGRILDVNDQFAALFGYAREELIGREILTLIAPEWRERIAQRMRTGEENLIEHRLQRKDGTILDAEAQSKTIPWGTRRVRVTAVRDITSRKQAEQALRESGEKFSKAFQTSPDVMSITDFATGCYLEVNDSHEKTFGFKREEVVGHSPIELGILENAAVREAMLKTLKDCGRLRDVELQVHTRDGRTLTLLHSAQLIELGGRLCVLRVSHDITDRKRAEAEREQAITRERQARLEYTLQLIASQEAERKRIAGELHDGLGQSLSIIKNHAQLALQLKTLAVEAREEIAAISDMSSQAIAEVRQISRDLHPYQLDHLGLTRALEALVESSNEASRIAFKKKFDPVDDAFSRDAALHLYRIVQEGVNNILKYSRARTARVALDRDVHEVQLTIEDDGCGFKPDETGNSGKGTGLKNIAGRTRMLGGSLKLDSSPGNGTRLEITIPISAGPE